MLSWKVARCPVRLQAPYERNKDSQRNFSPLTRSDCLRRNSLALIPVSVFEPVKDEATTTCSNFLAVR